MKANHRMNRARALAALLGLGALGGASAQSKTDVIGRWLTEKGDAVVEFYRCANEVCGKLAWMAHVPRDGTPARDRKNPDESLRQRPLCGLTMLGGFRSAEKGREWQGGWIYNPETGQTFKAQLQIEQPGQLKLRGYVGLPIFGQSQTWTAAEDGFPPCGQP